MAAAAAASTGPNADAAATTSVAPIVHALGGSIGSALALLLFYPLERARIELQSQASLIDPVVEDARDNHNDASDKNGLSPPSNNMVIVDPENDGDDDDDSATSWMSLEEQQNQQRLKAGNADIAATTSIRKNLSSSTKLLLQRQRFISYWSHKSKIGQVLVELQQRGDLYKGMTPIISTIFTSQFIFFFLHAYVKRLLLPVVMKQSCKEGGSPSALLSLAASCLAGIGNVLITNPLWVTNMAIVMGETKSQNLLHELVQLYKSRGLAHLWDGTSASILLVSNPIIQFFCYEQFKHAWLQQHSVTSPSSSSLMAVEAFFIAALAKGIATVTTYPLQLAQTLLRLGKSNDGISDDEGTTSPRRVQHRDYKGTVDCLLKLYQNNNNTVAAWFTGMRAKLLQTVLTAAFTFLTYEQIVGAVQAMTLMQNTRRVAQ